MRTLVVVFAVALTTVATVVVVRLIAFQVIRASIAKEWAARPEIENWALPGLAADQPAWVIAWFAAAVVLLLGSVVAWVALRPRKTAVVPADPRVPTR